MKKVQSVKSVVVGMTLVTSRPAQAAQEYRYQVTFYNSLGMRTGQGVLTATIPGVARNIMDVKLLQSDNWGFHFTTNFNGDDMASVTFLGQNQGFARFSIQPSAMQISVANLNTFTDYLQGGYPQGHPSYVIDSGKMLLAINRQRVIGSISFSGKLNTADVNSLPSGRPRASHVAYLDGQRIP